MLSETPTPATMRPTSPRETMPMPTRMPCLRSLRKNAAGRPQPSIFVATAMTMTMPLSISMLASIFVKSTSAPMIAKKSGANIRPTLPI